MHPEFLVPVEYRRGKKRPLPEPTQALPGSAEKVAVLDARLARGEQLWHPLDATVSLDGVRPRVPLSAEDRPKGRGGPHRQRKAGAGVCLVAGRFQVSIGRRVRGRLRHFYGGRFDTREEAERAADALAERLDVKAQRRRAG